MKKDILNNYLGRVGISTGFLKIFYTFTSGENDVVWNDLYTKAEHYCDSTNLSADKFPGLSIGYTDTPSSLISGSGYFTKNDMVRVGSGIGYDEWTAFLDFGNESCASSSSNNKSQSLISSMDGPDSISGFNLGINDSNRLYLEYNGKYTKVDGTEAYAKVNHTLGSELSKFSVVSVSYNNFLKEFGVTFHDFPNGVHNNLSFNAEGYTAGAVWHLGGMNNPNNLYTGYSGHMDDFVFFSKGMSPSERNSFSEAFFVDSIIPESSIASSGLVPIPGTPTVNFTGIIGTGVTGQECEIATTVEQKVGSDINLYQQSDLTGVITGEVIEWGVSGSGYQTTFETVPEKIIYNTGELVRHSKPYIVFDESPTANDIYEFYLFKKPKPNLNEKTAFLNNNGSNPFSYDSTYTPGADINVYLNGLSQVSGDSYVVTDFNGTTAWSIFSDGDYLAHDAVAYDQVKGDTLVSGFAGNPSSTHNITGVSGEPVSGKDVYLNGQKLISGEDYQVTTTTATNDTVQLYAGTLDGELYFMPQAQDITSIITGNSSDKVLTDSVDEVVWLNGVKQIENQDYFRINECSIARVDKKVKKYTYPIYNNNKRFFNI
tara:strand:- start:1789 stop:3588 length:1800 start_codon:yes stop_codon:yes gene_type:complete